MSNSSFSMDDYDNISNYRVTQTAHGFTKGQVLRTDTVAGTYALAQADSDSNAEVAGIVSEVIDANTFKLRIIGRQTGLSALVTDTVYFLSHVTPGALTTTDPATIGSGFVSKPVLLTDSTTSGMILTYRGINDGGEGDGGTLELDNLADVNVPTPSDNDILTYDSGTGKWINEAAAGGGGSMELVSTATASASSSIDFTNLDLTATAKYVAVLSGLNLSTDASLGFRLSSDNGSTFPTSTYISTFHKVTQGGTGTSGANNTTELLVVPETADGNEGYTSICATINLYGGTTTRDVRGDCSSSSYDLNGTALSTTLGYYTTFDYVDVDAIRFLPSTGTITAGKISLYKVTN
jgi:hypothetical protein